MRHRFHALCPYFAMFPEDFASEWIQRLSRPGEAVLDPFSGRGTAPFQALLEGRSAVGNDLNPVAYCVTAAKLNPPSLDDLTSRFDALEDEYSSLIFQRSPLPEFFVHAFHRETLAQLCFLRERLKWEQGGVDSMVAALVLGSLHGELSSPHYLSNQMPRTISTKPAYSIRYWRARGLRPPRRDVFSLLRARAEYRYETPPPEGHAMAFHGDIRELPRALRATTLPIRTVITSPPYLDVTHYGEDQWLRAWFLGGEPRPTGRRSGDDRHASPERYWAFIADAWRSMGAVLDERSNVVFRIAVKGRTPAEVVDLVEGAAFASGRAVTVRSYSASEIARRQTNAFRPGTAGCVTEVDIHLAVA